MTVASFNEAVTAAQSRHQEAVRLAHEEFNVAVAQADRERDELYAAASDAWDAVEQPQPPRA
jgi:hypothetical protein